MTEYPEKLKHVTHDEYLHGDFDEDGIENIDDKRPFRKRKSDSLDPEVKLSDAFYHVKEKREEAKELAKRYGKEHGYEHRVKSEPSIFRKLAVKKLHTLGDVIGFRKTFDTRAEAREHWSKYNKRHSKTHKGVKVYEKENKYKTLVKDTSNPYRAYHSNIKIGGFTGELQFLSKAQLEVNKEMHSHYKEQTKKGYTKNIPGMELFMSKTRHNIKRGL